MGLSGLEQARLVYCEEQEENQKALKERSRRVLEKF